MAIPIFKEFANGIRDVKDGRFFPYQTRVSGPSAEVLPKKQNVRHYIKSLTISVSSLGTDVGTEAVVTGMQFNELSYLAKLVKTASVVNLASQSFRVGVLMDREAVLAFTAADITTASVQVVFCEVDDYEST